MLACRVRFDFPREASGGGAKPVSFLCLMTVFCEAAGPHTTQIEKRIVRWRPKGRFETTQGTTGRQKLLTSFVPAFHICSRTAFSQAIFSSALSHSNTYFAWSTLSSSSTCDVCDSRSAWLSCWVCAQSWEGKTSSQQVVSFVVVPFLPPAHHRPRRIG